MYCFEGADNGGDVRGLSLKADSAPTVLSPDETLGGAVKIAVEAKRTADFDGLYSFSPPQKTPCTAVAVPYHVWGNRGENQMRVWMETV